MVNPSFRSWARFRDFWATLPGYQRFEVLVALALRGVIAAIIVVALYRLIVAVIDTLVIQALNPLDHVVFQAVFGAIMTLLIALLALARKIIVAELYEIGPASVAALAALTLSLGVTYRLMREGDDAPRPAGENGGTQKPRPGPA